MLATAVALFYIALILSEVTEVSTGYKCIRSEVFTVVKIHVAFMWV
jgi:hypothetical protein